MAVSDTFNKMNLKKKHSSSNLLKKVFKYSNFQKLLNHSSKATNSILTITNMKTFPLDNHQAISLIHESTSNYLIIGTTSGGLLQYNLSNHQITKCIKTTLLQITSLIYWKSTIYAGGSTIIQQFNQDLEVLKELNDHNDSIIGLSIYEDSLISASEDQTVRKWLQNKSQVLYSHNSPLIAFDLSTSLSKIASSCSDSVLIIFSLKSNKVEKEIVSLSDKIWSLKFISKNSTLLAGDHSGNIVIRSLPDFSEIQKISLHESRVKSLTVSQDEDFFLSCSFDQTVLAFQTSDYKNIYKFEEHHDWVRATAACLKVKEESSCYYRKKEKVYTGFSVADDKSVGIFEFQREDIVEWNFWILAFLGGIIVFVLVYYVGFEGFKFNEGTGSVVHTDLIDSQKNFIQTKDNQIIESDQIKINQEVQGDSHSDQRKIDFVKEEQVGYQRFEGEGLLNTQSSSEEIRNLQEITQSFIETQLEDQVEDNFGGDLNILSIESELGEALLQLNNEV
jgi:WD40 repeat protein